MRAQPILRAGHLGVLAALAVASCGGDDGGDRVDTTPPRVVSTDPPAGAVGVPVDEALLATFSERINAASIDPASFTLTTGDMSVSGSASITGRTVRFTPSSSLSPSAGYTATLSGSITDGAGNPLGADFSWSFVTETDEWRATSTPGAPEGRRQHTAVWTGSEMIVWGGLAATGFKGDGGRYRPGNDQWLAMAVSPLIPRTEHTAVWTGERMIVWGGADAGAELNDGAHFVPTDGAAGSWSLTSPSPILARSGHTAVWAETENENEMIVWGGLDIQQQLSSAGARYSPDTDDWTLTSMTNAPTGRTDHTAVWTGSEMIVWGGVDSFGVTNTGARYRPASDTWEPLSMVNAPLSRRDHTAVWTGTEMIVWGGMDGLGLLHDGARYDPVTDTWTPISSVNAPTAREKHVAVWTGYEMIVWGGDGVDSVKGGRYRPTTDTWRETAIADAPVERFDHTAVWTGGEMIVWGGQTSAELTNTGGRYTP